MDFFIGLELLNLWNIQDFELLDFIRRGLQCYDSSGRPIISYSEPSRPEEDYALFSEAAVQLEAIKTFSFKFKDVQFFASANGLPAPLSKEKPEPEPLPPPEVNPENRVERKNRLRLACRRAAKQLWAENPEITITGMVERSEIIEMAEGRSHTVRYGWIRDLRPPRKPEGIGTGTGAVRMPGDLLIFFCMKKMPVQPIYFDYLFDRTRLNTN
ncbi:MAG: hypothetical protein HQK57_13555 [Deltaproteobacteria bacterium]|nr:hypothetical protein [Deltaproteobacteria bacterium]